MGGQQSIIRRVDPDTAIHAGAELRWPNSWDRRDTVFLAEVGGQLAGYARVSVRDDPYQDRVLRAGWVELLVSYQRGVGSALVRAAVEYLKSYAGTLGSDNVFAGCERELVPFWVSCGFVPLELPLAWQQSDSATYIDDDWVQFRATGDGRLVSVQSTLGRAYTLAQLRPYVDASVLMGLPTTEKGLDRAMPMPGMRFLSRRQSVLASLKEKVE